MKLHALDGAFFEGFPVRRQIASLKVGERESPRFVPGRCGVGRRLAVVLEELHDPAAGRQFDQPLLEPHQQVFNLGGLGVGLLMRDLAHRDEVLLAVVAEDGSEASVPLLERGHWMSPTSPQLCCQIVATGDLRRGDHLP
jgi:hypothetical protein